MSTERIREILNGPTYYMCWKPYLFSSSLPAKLLALFIKRESSIATQEWLPTDNTKVFMYISSVVCSSKSYHFPQDEFLRSSNGRKTNFARSGMGKAKFSIFFMVGRASSLEDIFCWHLEVDQHLNLLFNLLISDGCW